MNISLVAAASALLFLATLPAPASIQREADGSFTATNENYSARIGADGNLHSLVCGGTEFLLDGLKGLVGGGYITIKEGTEWTAEVYKFTKVEQTAPDTVTASADKHTLAYRFLPDAIDLVFSHTADPTIWILTVNPAVKDMIERDSGETIPPKTVWREGRPQLFNAQGSSVALPAGALYYIAKNAREKPDTDPEVLQVWMPRTWGEATITNRLVIHTRPTAADAMQALVAVPQANHIFPGAQPAAITLDAKMRFPGIAVDGKAELVATDYLTKREVFRQSDGLKLAPMGQARAAFAVSPPPGFYEATLTVTAGADVLATRRFPFAYDIQHMTPPERPADFNKFWDDTLAEQQKIPPNVQLTLFKEESGSRLYKMRFDGLMGRQFHAWLSVPTNGAKCLAHLTLPPSGINPPYLPYSGPNVLGMSLAIAGQEVEPPAGGYQYWDYFRSGIDRRETWYYRAVFAACSRAIDILSARPEVDTNRVFVTGGSQGGGLSFITAALNPKVTMAVCGSPGLFGLEWKLRHLPSTFWPPIDPIDEKNQPITDPQAIDARCKVARYADAANFAPRIHGSVLLNVGLQDHVTSQAGALAAWSQLKNARIKAMLADPWGGHNGPRGGQALGSAWLGALSAGQPDRVLQIQQASGDVLPVLVEGQP